MRLVRVAAAGVGVAAPRTPLRLLGRGLAAMSSESLKSVDYEVFGHVQGVCFRMYTEGEAKKLGVVGWVKNTSKGTVTGQVQGPEEKVNSMCLSLHWYEIEMETRERRNMFLCRECGLHHWIGKHS
ncbi:acylphosphatase-2 isoform X2 [Tenrec ecaudatus]|uniref:acylphosphatase-2 isoform X2 n=1 Tax=Tenrec ecaudatus TaxID=94439 RepID=UPI003F5A0386